MVMLPQLLMLTPTGAMKSLISAVKDEEERLLTNVLPNASHTPGWKTPAPVRSIAASPKRLPVRLRCGLGPEPKPEQDRAAEIPLPPGYLGTWLLISRVLFRYLIGLRSPHEVVVAEAVGSGRFPLDRLLSAPASTPSNALAPIVQLAGGLALTTFEATSRALFRGF
jgi:hypothetical protein